jgi:hypothetical protein
MVKVNLPIWLLWDPIEPPSHIANPVIELEPGTWERWLCDGCDDEYVGSDAAAKCEAYMAWCGTEKKKRFDAILDDAGLANDRGEQAERWRNFALSLVGRQSELLTIPDPRPPRKRRGRKNVDAAMIEAVNRELEKDEHRSISAAEAFRRANKDGVWTERQFKMAINRWYNANPLAERPRGRPKKVHI